MAQDSFRTLLRRIALGMPLIVGPLALGGCQTDGGGCGDPETETMIVTSAPDGGTDCWVACPSALSSGKQLATCGAEDGGAGYVCTYEWVCIGGRRPEERVTARVRGGSDAQARWLLELAAMEAASVPAFEALARALASHGAPSDLVDRARASVRDEERHTKLALSLAGGGSVHVHVPHAAVSSLAELAAHNAREGVVREAYGALEAAFQSQHAADERARAVFGTIARDEARHALLSHDVDAWAREHVDASILDAARADAISELREALRTRERPDGLGLPDADEAIALLAQVA